MKKEWIKRENMYYKPFYKNKTKMLLLIIFLSAILVFLYQCFIISNLPINTPLRPRLQEFREVVKPINKKTDEALETKIIRGIRLFDYDAYKPHLNIFKCLSGNQVISYKHLNDDYCDCDDGSDEPSTSACVNGKFFCKYQKRHLTGRGRDIYIPSSRVNDGICDCCDGSDEWILSNVFCKNICYY